VHPKKFAALCALSGPERYRYFLRKIADFEVAWGLYDAGWATASNDDGNMAIPFWPEADFAAACAIEEWASFAPKEISVQDLLEKWLPGMGQNGDLVAVFPTPESKGVFVEPKRLAEDIQEESEQYE
jgi:hypothetical protein